MPTNEVTAARSGGDIIEAVILKGDLSRLTPEESVRYYKAVCESVGLNPLTRPFEYLTLQGRRILYARKEGTDQLRDLRGVSIEVVSRSVDDDLAMVHVRARDRAGRTDEDFGAVNVAGLKGEARANALLKAITKAKRRVTLSISGLGFLDESEVEDIEPRDITPPADTAADLDAFVADGDRHATIDEAELRHAAATAAQGGTEAFRAHWGTLSAAERQPLRTMLSHYQAAAVAADDEAARDDDPFGLPPLPEPVSEAPAVPLAAAARALVPIAGEDGEPDWQAWSEAFVGMIKAASREDCGRLRISSLPEFGKCRTEAGDAARAILEALAARAQESTAT